MTRINGKQWRKSLTDLPTREGPEQLAHVEVSYETVGGSLGVWTSWTYANDPAPIIEQARQHVSSLHRVRRVTSVHVTFPEQKRHAQVTTIGGPAYPAAEVAKQVGQVLNEQYPFGYRSEDKEP